jgi:hypothetical protein
MECIARWLKTISACPLCNATWIYPQALTLKQRAAVKFVDNEPMLLEMTAQELDPSIYTALDVDMHTYRRERLPAYKQRLLAHVFGKYLTKAELEKLLASKEAGKI